MLCGTFHFRSGKVNLWPFWAASGGKTTLLNIVGGLDSYSSGELTIGGISKKFKNRDWDAYRNHTVGFIFKATT